MLKGALEFRRLCPELAPAFSRFLAALSANGDDALFHPHPFNADQAERLCAYTGQDLYYVALANGEVLAYGMLRGWDEGYEMPSLGIAVHPQVRGKQIATALMHFLHSAALHRGVKRIRLKVYRNNAAARKLYDKFGYRYETSTGAELVGFCDLTGKAG
jgi:ribosomal protein S18 acetylase RimI-like enzyme